MAVVCTELSFRYDRIVTDSENRGRQNQEGVRSEQDLVAMRSRGPLIEIITIDGP